VVDEEVVAVVVEDAVVVGWPALVGDTHNKCYASLNTT
jgi:hypothetical protein